MGTRIECVAVVRGRPWPAPGALRLEDEAARLCLKRAGRRPDEIDLLVNAGIYRDDNTAEPALASIIQHDIGANPGLGRHGTHTARHGTFSFDVTNGGAGSVTAAFLIDGFVGPGSAHLGLVVAGDADPSPSTSRNFPFVGAAGAMLLGHTEGDAGFQRFAFRTFPAYAPLFESRLTWDAEIQRNVLSVRQDPGFAAACVDGGAKVVAEVLDAARLRPSEVDVLAASPHPEAFPLHLARAIGIPDERVATVREGLERTHTAGVLASLQAAFDSGALRNARNVVIVGVGAGITVGVGLYRPS
jgi:3-oxoacyl-[acyl-carrier-protein] synthase-3